MRFLALLSLLYLWTHSILVAGERPNVLFIAVDDLRLNLGCYGDPVAVTPNLDGLAQRAVVFERAYCQFPSCNASRASLLTGMRPDSISVYRLQTHFRDTAPDVVTLPQHFKSHGYHTEAIGKVLHNYNSKIKDDDLSWSIPARLDKVGHFDDYAIAKNGRNGQAKGVVAECADVEDAAYADGQMVADALETIERLASRKQPFFLAVGFLKPHSPYNAPQKYWELYRPEDIEPLGETTRPKGVPELNWFDATEIRTFQDVPREGPIPQATAARMRHGYYAATSFVDAGVGRLLGALKDAGVADHTIVVFWSDHGYHLGENDHWTKVMPRDLDARIPLIIHAPRAATAQSGALVESIDIFPTLCELCDLPVPQEIDGRSFAKVLHSPELEARSVVLTQVVRPWPGKKPLTSMAYSLRTKRYRFTQWVDLETCEVLAEELYDEDSDPLERKNVVDDEAYQEIRRRLQELMQETTKGGGGEHRS